MSQRPPIILFFCTDLLPREAEDWAKCRRDVGTVVGDLATYARCVFKVDEIGSRTAFAGRIAAKKPWVSRRRRQEWDLMKNVGLLR